VVAVSGVEIRQELLRFASDRKLSLIELKVEEYSMENIFKELTSAESGI